MIYESKQTVELCDGRTVEIIPLNEEEAWKALREGKTLMRYQPYWEERVPVGRKWDVMCLLQGGRFEMYSRMANGERRKVDALELNPLEGKWALMSPEVLSVKNPAFMRDMVDDLRSELEMLKERMR